MIIKARHFLNIYSISMGLTLNGRGPMIFILIPPKNSGIEVKKTENSAVRGHLDPIENSAVWKSVLHEAVLCDA